MLIRERVESNGKRKREGEREREREGESLCGVCLTYTARIGRDPGSSTVSRSTVEYMVALLMGGGGWVYKSVCGKQTKDKT